VYTALQLHTLQTDPQVNGLQTISVSNLELHLQFAEPAQLIKKKGIITSFLEKVSENNTSERTQARTHKTNKQLCYGWWSTTQTETEHVTSSARRLPPKSMPANV
jgi:hypothetical protein